MNGLRNFSAALRRFWFAPQDPTTLGFIRVVTGLMVLYTHLAYSFDLYAFFGKDAWWDLASVNRERMEYPHTVLPLNGWDDRIPSARVPEAPHRKKAVLKWMSALRADATKRENGLKLLRDIQSFVDAPGARSILVYVQQLRSDPTSRKLHLDTLVNAALRQPLDESAIPNVLRNLPETGTPSRTSFREAIDRFYSTLPDDADERQFVINHLLEMDERNRAATVAFLDDPATDENALEYLRVWGWERRKAYRLGHPIFSLWFHVSDPGEMAVAHVAILIVMTLFTLGLWTRVTSVLTWLAAVSYIHRSQMVLFGMDTMSNILLIYLMVGNSGGAFSLDRLIARYRAARASLKRCGTIDGPTATFLAAPPATMSAGLAIRLLQVHFCFIYMAAGLSKLQGQTWWNHNAYWDTVANPEFTMIQFEWYEAVMQWLAQNRILYALTAGFAIFHTFIAEIGLPFLAWTRARWWIVIVAFLLHAGIAIFMGLTVFSLLMMIMLLGYLPGAAIRGRLCGIAEKKLSVNFNPNDDSQAVAASRILAIDTESGIVLKPDPQARGITVNDGPERQQGSAAVKAVAERSSLISWMTWIPGMSAVLRTVLKV